MQCQALYFFVIFFFVSTPLLLIRSLTEDMTGLRDRGEGGLPYVTHVCNGILHHLSYL